MLHTSHVDVYAYVTVRAVIVYCSLFSWDTELSTWVHFIPHEYYCHYLIYYWYFYQLKNSLIFNVYKHGIVILQVTIDNQPPTTQYWPGVQMWYFCMEATVYMIVYTTYSCSRRLLWIRQYYNIVHLGNEEWNFRLFYDFTNWLFRSKQQ